MSTAQNVEPFETSWFIDNAEYNHVVATYVPPKPANDLAETAWDPAYIEKSWLPFSTPTAAQDILHQVPDSFFSNIRQRCAQQSAHPTVEYENWNNGVNCSYFGQTSRLAAEPLQGNVEIPSQETVRQGSDLADPPPNFPSYEGQQRQYWDRVEDWSSSQISRSNFVSGHPVAASFGQTDQHNSTAHTGDSSHVQQTSIFVARHLEGNAETSGHEIVGSISEASAPSNSPSYDGQLYWDYSSGQNWCDSFHKEYYHGWHPVGAGPSRQTVSTIRTGDSAQTASDRIMFPPKTSPEQYHGLDSDRPHKLTASHTTRTKEHHRLSLSQNTMTKLHNGVLNVSATAPIPEEEGPVVVPDDLAPSLPRSDMTQFLTRMNDKAWVGTCQYLRRTGTACDYPPIDPNTGQRETPVRSAWDRHFTVTHVLAEARLWKEANFNPMEVQTRAHWILHRPELARNAATYLVYCPFQGCKSGSLPCGRRDIVRRHLKGFHLRDQPKLTEYFLKVLEKPRRGKGDPTFHKSFRKLLIWLKSIA